MIFNIGYYVVAIDSQDGNEDIVGKEGRIVAADELWDGKSVYLVHFDIDVDGHRGGKVVKDYNIPAGHGWWMDEDNIELADISLENV